MVVEVGFIVEAVDDNTADVDAVDGNEGFTVFWNAAYN